MKRHTSSLIVRSLSDQNSALWEKYRVEPVGAVYAPKEDPHLHTYPEVADYLPVTIFARDGEEVLFYNHGRDENFGLGMLTAEKDSSGDSIIEIATLMVRNCRRCSAR